MSSKKSRDSSKSKHSSKDGKSKTKSSTVDEDAMALAEEEEERRRRRKERKRLEEEERLRREREEQEAAEEEERIRKLKASRIVSPPTKHKTPVDNDENYDDDFVQNYDDDFDDEPPPPPKKSSSTRHAERTRSPQRDDVAVYSTTTRFQYQDVSDQIRRRFKDLSRLIVLDRQSFNILEMTPMGGHAAYLRSRTDDNSSTNDNSNSPWTSNVKTQTNDDAEHVSSQTDEIDQRPIWTQHPSENDRMACGSGNLADDKESKEEKKKRQNEELLRTLRLETDLGRYQTFVINAGKLMFALLDEQENDSIKSKSKKAKDNDENERMQKESNLSFASGMTILPGLQFKTETSMAATCFFPDKPEQIAVFYEPNHTTSFGAIYTVKNPDKPMRLLSCEATIRCCSSASNFLFAGCHDGSVVVFDTSEPNRYKANSSDPLPCAPTFSTANIQFNDRHFNEVIRVLPLRNNSSTGGSFPLASLDRDGLIILWSVVELLQSDEAGSIADLGLKPGGKVRLTQTSSLRLKPSIHMSPNSIETFDISFPFNDVDHLYVATNASAVYHMTRYGEMGSPAKLRISSDTQSQIEVTCLAFNPIISKLVLVGTSHGQLNLYTTNRDEPILVLANAFRSTSTVRSCSWSSGRASVFFAHDSYGSIKFWDLTKDLSQPIGQVKIDNLEHFLLSSSNQYETAFVLISRKKSSQIEIHQLKRSYAAHSDSFMDNFKTILKDLMSNS